MGQFNIILLQASPFGFDLSIPCIVRIRPLHGYRRTSLSIHKFVCDGGFYVSFQRKLSLLSGISGAYMYPVHTTCTCDIRYRTFVSNSSISKTIIHVRI